MANQPCPPGKCNFLPAKSFTEVYWDFGDVARGIIADREREAFVCPVCGEERPPLVWQENIEYVSYEGKGKDTTRVVWHRYTAPVPSPHYWPVISTKNDHVINLQVNGSGNIRDFHPKISKVEDAKILLTCLHYNEAQEA